MLTCTTLSGCLSPPAPALIDLTLAFSTDHPPWVYQGIVWTYTLTVTNNGPIAALDAALTLTADLGFTRTGGTLPASVALAIGESKTFTVEGSFAETGAATLTATIAAPTGSIETNPRNNQDSLPITVLVLVLP